jgi:hypothetical protein
MKAAQTTCLHTPFTYKGSVQSLSLTATCTLHDWQLLLWSASVSMLPASTKNTLGCDTHAAPPRSPQPSQDVCICTQAAVPICSCALRPPLFGLCPPPSSLLVFATVTWGVKPRPGSSTTISLPWARKCEITASPSRCSCSEAWPGATSRYSTCRQYSRVDLAVNCNWSTVRLQCSEIAVQSV